MMDLAVVNALQINPRISWAALGQILSIDPSTLSRRWIRMTTDRRVWSSCFHEINVELRHRATALVEVGCEPGEREKVIQRLADEGPVSSIHCTSGGRDLVLTVMLPDLLAIDRYVDEVIAVVPGVRRLETHYLRHLFQEGSDWRPRALTPARSQAVAATLPTGTSPPKPSGLALELIAAIGDDVRRPVTELQRRVGRSLSAVSRGVDALLVAPWAHWRVDFSHNLLGWQEVMLWLDVPQDDLDHAAAAMRLFRQARLCVSSTGTANLIVTLWVRELDELDDIERTFSLSFPKARVIDRCVVPRIAKRMGHVIGYDSRVERYVPFTDTQHGQPV